VYGSSEGLHTIVVERGSIGGQAGSSSMIRNYLGFARGIGGAELARQAYEQAWLFGARFLAGREVVRLQCGDDTHLLTTADGIEISARTVILATGVTYNRLAVPALERLVGEGVYYGAAPGEARHFTGKYVYVVGAGNSAGQAVLHLARWAETATLVVRGSSLEKSMSRYLIDEIEAAANVEVLVATRVVDGSGNGQLETLTLADCVSGGTSVVPADALFAFIGAQPHTGWLPSEVARDAHGFVVTGAELTHDGLLDDWLLPRSPRSFETSIPGVFAVGDVRSRSMKRVASAVGEGSGAIKEIHHYLELQAKWSALRRSKA
jgi:thioredoxin reductase (NADPH)